jgi:site-specific DNA-methyltransferase (adenine-specific)
MLPDDGFIALFCRGTSFYRWNTRLAELGFVFKEELVWDKRMPSSPVTALSRNMKPFHCAECCGNGGRGVAG